MQYKTLGEGEALVRRNKRNAAQKRYHHHLRSSDYRSAVPKSERMEAEMIAKGVVPQTVWENWVERSKLEALVIRLWGTMDKETGVLDWGPEISKAAEKLVHARAVVVAGHFKPNREKDKLTYALENLEHDRCTRGYGVVPWYHSFQADRETYRSCQRKKDEEAEQIHKLEEYVHESKECDKIREEWMRDEVKRQVQAALSEMTRGALHHHSRRQMSTLAARLVEEQLHLHGSINRSS